MSNTLLINAADTFLFKFNAMAQSCQLREYPLKFGFKMVELYDQLITTKKGVPALPPCVPPALDTFNSMTFGLDAESLWQEASMVDVCRYLRGGTNLNIPDEFRYHLPRRLWYLKRSLQQSSVYDFQDLTVRFSLKGLGQQLQNSLDEFLTILGRKMA